jgi:hypothetical protein
MYAEIRMNQIPRRIDTPFKRDNKQLSPPFMYLVTHLIHFLLWLLLLSNIDGLFFEIISAGVLSISCEAD